MDSKQRRLARHALGLPNDSKRSYRNRYVTAPGTPEHDMWLAMEGAKEAVRTPGDEMGLGKNDHFRLRHAGAKAALDPGEMLDPEDFPSAADLAEQ